jgi:hypothetical protein
MMMVRTLQTKPSAPRHLIVAGIGLDKILVPENVSTHPIIGHSQSRDSFQAVKLSLPRCQRFLRVETVAAALGSEKCLKIPC